MAVALDASSSAAQAVPGQGVGVSWGDGEQQCYTQGFEPPGLLEQYFGTGSLDLFAETHGQETTQSANWLEVLSTSKLALGLRPQEEQGSSQTWDSTVGVSPGLKSGIQGEPCSFWWQDSKSVSHSVSHTSE